MIQALRRIARQAAGLPIDPRSDFHAAAYLRHNQRRQEHLASLRLDLAEASVLEVGAGIGDHTSFFLDRGCRVVSAEPRAANLAVLRARYPDLPTLELDLDAPQASIPGAFDIVYCYGVLYHLGKPAQALELMAAHCTRLLLLETCVSAADDDSLNPCDEPADWPSQSITGRGCRPSRRWVHRELTRHFERVYMPITQPSHEEFPLDWSRAHESRRLTRAVFIASRIPMVHELLVEHLPATQRRS